MAAVLAGTAMLVWGGAVCSPDLCVRCALCGENLALPRVEEVIAGFPQTSYFSFDAPNEGMSVVWIDTSDN